MNNILANSAVGLVCIALAMTLSLTSCQHGDNPIDSLVSKPMSAQVGSRAEIASAQRQPLSSQEAAVINGQLSALSKAVAKALGKKEICDYIHKRCMNRFDGATNVLWKHLDEEASVFGTTGWSGLIAANSDARFSAISLKSLVNALNTRVEAQLHLFWYNAEQWDGKTTPIVVYIPANQDDIRVLPGFDNVGMLYQIDKVTAQKKPIIVIAINERTDKEGNLRTSQPIQAVGTHNPKFDDRGSVQSAHFRILTVNLPNNTAWYDGIFNFNGTVEPQARIAQPGGSAYQFVNFSAVVPPTSFSPNSLVQAAPSSAPYTEVQWWELDDSIGEWALGPDDPLGSHQVYANGSGWQGYNPSVLYQW